MKENDTYCTTLYTDEELKKILSPDQYRVVKLNGTEFPFANRYWNNKDKGIYVDVVSGEALFASVHKYDSGTGWPSFFKPINEDTLVFKKDFDLGYERVEVRSKADSHLGHVFDDGPQPTGKRFCINSASLRFVPFERMVQEGYSDFLYLFDEQLPAI